jgi:hypothetical protein
VIDCRKDGNTLNPNDISKSRQKLYEPAWGTRKVLYDFVQGSNPRLPKISPYFMLAAVKKPAVRPQINAPPSLHVFYICSFEIFLFDLVLEVLPCDQIWDVIVVVVFLVFTTCFLLHRLITLGKLSEGGEGVRAELVEDTGDEFGEFLVFTVSIDGKGVGWDSGVDCRRDRN